ncbi:hypothetical protein BGZ65_012199, partial [Modicella reniformis]
MRFITLALGLASLIAAVSAGCNDNYDIPPMGLLGLFAKPNCPGKPIDVGVVDKCQNDVGFRACSADAKHGYRCDIFGSNGCNNNLIAKVNSSGQPDLCKWRAGVLVQSVICRK